LYTEIYIQRGLWQFKLEIKLNEKNNFAKETMQRRKKFERRKTYFERKERQIHRNIGSYYTQSHHMSRNISRHYTEGHAGRGIWRGFRGGFRGGFEGFLGVSYDFLAKGALSKV